MWRQARVLFVKNMDENHVGSHFYPMVVKDFDDSVKAEVIPLLLHAVSMVTPLYHVLVSKVFLLEHLLSDAVPATVHLEAPTGLRVRESPDWQPPARANRVLLCFTDSNYCLSRGVESLIRGGANTGRRGRYTPLLKHGPATSEASRMKIDRSELELHGGGSFADT